MVITSCFGLSEKRSVCSEKQEDILQKQSLVSGCRSATLFEKRLMHRFFSEKFLNFFRTALL